MFNKNIGTIAYNEKLEIETAKQQISAVLRSLPEQIEYHEEESPEAARRINSDHIDTTVTFQKGNRSFLTTHETVKTDLAELSFGFNLGSAKAGVFTTQIEIASNGTIVEITSSFNHSSPSVLPYGSYNNSCVSMDEIRKFQYESVLNKLNQLHEGLKTKEQDIDLGEINFPQAD